MCEPIIRNGSFEDELPGINPPVPDYWLEVRGTEEDRIELIDDPRQAHWGRRCLCVYSGGEKGVRLYALDHLATDFHGLELEPGQTYVINVWAKAQADAQARLIVEPGHGAVDLTQQWRQFTFRHHHPDDAPRTLGLMLKVVGGPAFIDDVSMTAEGDDYDVPPSLRADRTALRKLPIDDTWHQKPDEPIWHQRVTVRVSEVMGEDVQNHAVEFALQRIVPEIRFDWVSTDRIKVVAACESRPVQAKFVLLQPSRQDMDSKLIRFEGRTGWDRLAFRVSCPALSTTTYFIYVADRRPDGREIRWPSDLPIDWLKSQYQHQLDVQIGRPVDRLGMTSRVEADCLTVRAWHWTAETAQADLFLGDGGRRLSLNLLPSETEPHVWVSELDYRLPAEARDQISKVVVRFGDSNGRTDLAQSAFVCGSALWCGLATKRIFRSDPPVHAADTVDLAAARREREAFQVVVASSDQLRRVRFSATDLVHENNEDRIARSALSFEQVDEIYCSCPVVGPGSYVQGFGPIAHDGRAGWYPDPLLPWRSEDVPAGQQKVSWVTLSVPERVRAGHYRGHVVATADGGKRFCLPINLRVYDFTLPKRLRFTSLIGADIQLEHQDGKSPCHERDLVLSIASMLGHRGICPFYYCPAQQPFPLPWRYDPDQHVAHMDFSEFDDNARFLLEDAGIPYLLFCSEYRREIFDGGKGLETRYRARNGTAQADAMWRAWAEAVGEHLTAQGWLEQAYVYVFDEPGPSDLPTIDRIARLLKEKYPVRTFGAVVGTANPDELAIVDDQEFVRRAGKADLNRFLASIDAISGRLNESNRKHLQAMGNQYWGVYNRFVAIGIPLATLRLIGVDSWREGANVYFHYSLTSHAATCWRSSGHTIDYLGAVGGYPAGTFPRYCRPASWSNAIYLWPEDEPDPAKRSVRSSIRLELLRKASEDYEYLQILRETADATPKGSAAMLNCEDIVENLEQILTESYVGGSWKHTFRPWGLFDLEPHVFEAFRRRIAEAIEASSTTS